MLTRAEPHKALLSFIGFDTARGEQGLPWRGELEPFVLFTIAALPRADVSPKTDGLGETWDEEAALLLQVTLAPPAFGFGVMGRFRASFGVPWESPLPGGDASRDEGAKQPLAPEGLFSLSIISFSWLAFSPRSLACRLAKSFSDATSAERSDNSTWSCCLEDSWPTSIMW